MTTRYRFAGEDLPQSAAPTIVDEDAPELVTSRGAARAAVIAAADDDAFIAPAVTPALMDEPAQVFAFIQRQRALAFDADDDAYSAPIIAPALVEESAQIFSFIQRQRPLTLDVDEDVPAPRLEDPAAWPEIVLARAVARPPAAPITDLDDVVVVVAHAEDGWMGLVPMSRARWAALLDGADPVIAGVPTPDLDPIRQPTRVLLTHAGAAVLLTQDGTTVRLY